MVPGYRRGAVRDAPERTDRTAPTDPGLAAPICTPVPAAKSLRRLEQSSLLDLSSTPSGGPNLRRESQRCPSPSRAIRYLALPCRLPDIRPPWQLVRFGAAHLATLPSGIRARPTCRSACPTGGMLPENMGRRYGAVLPLRPAAGGGRDRVTGKEVCRPVRGIVTGWGARAAPTSGSSRDELKSRDRGRCRTFARFMLGMDSAERSK
jgi:hypothetical protein